MAELTAAAIASIVAHMNDDHADSICDYARHFGALPDVASAHLRDLDSAAMTVVATSAGAEIVLSIPFDHALCDTDDARETLVAMARASGRPG